MAKALAAIAAIVLFALIGALVETIIVGLFGDD